MTKTPESRESLQRLVEHFGPASWGAQVWTALFSKPALVVAIDSLAVLFRKSTTASEMELLRVIRKETPNQLRPPEHQLACKDIIFENGSWHVVSDKKRNDSVLTKLLPYLPSEEKPFAEFLFRWYVAGTKPFPLNINDVRVMTWHF